MIHSVKTYSNRWDSLQRDVAQKCQAPKVSQSLQVTRKKHCYTDLIASPRQTAITSSDPRVTFFCWFHPHNSRSNSLNEYQSGWWYMYLPLWKIWLRQLEWLFPIYGTTKKTNHRSAICAIRSCSSCFPSSWIRWLHPKTNQTISWRP